MPTVQIRTNSGAEYRVVDENFTDQDDNSVGDLLLAIRTAVRDDISILCAVHFQGGSEAYREEMLFTPAHIESIGVKRV